MELLHLNEVRACLTRIGQYLTDLMVFAKHQRLTLWFSTHKPCFPQAPCSTGHTAQLAWWVSDVLGGWPKEEISVNTPICAELFWRCLHHPGSWSSPSSHQKHRSHRYPVHVAYQSCTAAAPLLSYKSGHMAVRLPINVQQRANVVATPWCLLRMWLTLAVCSAGLRRCCSAMQEPQKLDLSAPPPFTLADIRNAVPKHCWEKDTARSVFHLVKDVSIVLGLAAGASALDQW